MEKSYKKYLEEKAKKDKWYEKYLESLSYRDGSPKSMVFDFKYYKKKKKACG
jgi:hypothetical protein